MRSIVPLGMCHIVPLTSRTLVVRRVTCSTVPLASPASMMSPTPYWSSMSMKMPERKSLTRDWAPKPMATPAMPAPAMSGPRFTPSSPSIMTTAIDQMAMLAIDRMTWARVWARDAERSDSDPVSTMAAGARRLILRRRSWAVGSPMPSVKRRIARRTSLLTMMATTKITNTRSGASRRPVAWAHAREPVISRTCWQAHEGSSPHASRSSSAVWITDTSCHRSDLTGRR